MSDPQTLIATLGALLIPVLLFVFLGLMIWRAMGGGAARVAAQKLRLAQQLERATPGTALVVQSEASTYECRDQHGFGVYREITLTLEVSAAGGAYAATGKWDVQLTALPRVAPEQQVAVLVDADNPRVVYPAEDWARPSLALA